MLAKRIISALDIKDGRVVKGINFKDITDAGDPLELAKRYEDEGIDEIVFLDINASHENRGNLFELVKDVSRELHIPFTVGGGISTVDEVKKIIRKGADKIFVNTAAVENQKMIREGSKLIGSSNFMVAIDAKKKGDEWKIYTHGGRKERRLTAVEWAERVERLGAGEILLTSMDKDGTKDGFDIPLIKRISAEVNIPVIPSGGAGSPDDFNEVFKNTDVDAALAASIFHYDEYSVPELKAYLKRRGINVRY
ncbi:MAG: imidazole glycerol phosphate synthase subunit HisF [Thermoplasmata archaeon]